MVADYMAGYYSYYLANLYATDIFRTLFKDDPTDSAAGRRFRRGFLEKGGSRDEMDIMTEFLGREVEFDGLYEELNLA